MIEIECARCGEDCSRAYGTYNGYPFHLACLPTREDRHNWSITEDDEGYERPRLRRSDGGEWP